MANARAALARREIRKRQANGTFIGSAPAQYLNPKGAENKAFEFVNKYHSDTVNSGKARKNADGSITTVRARGVEYNGKIYTVPGYDRDTGRDLTEDQARERYMPQIQSGEIVGIPTAFDGPLEQHPANVGARLNHEWLDAAEVTDEQIGYDQGSAFDKYLEPAMVIGSSILAEPVSGMAGIVQSLNPFADEGAGARAVQDVQQAMTYQPRTEQGQSGMQAIGDSVVGDFGEIIQGAENKLGQWTLDATGSPVLATMAHSAPTALLEAIGLHSFGKTGRAAAKANRGTLNAGAPVDVRKAAVKELEKRGALDMSQSARMQRAIEQGYDVDTTWYHGTGADIKDGIKPSIHDEAVVSGVSLTQDPEYASLYATNAFGRRRKVEHGNKLSRDEALDRLQSGRMVWMGDDLSPSHPSPMMDSQHLDLQPEDIANNFKGYKATDLPDRTYYDSEPKVSVSGPEGGNVMPVHIKKMNIAGIDDYLDAADALEEINPEYTDIDMAKFLQDRGFGGVNIMGDEVLVLDTNQIRSVNAAFDPASIGQNKLLGSADPRILPATGAGALVAEKLLREEED